MDERAKRRREEVLRRLDEKDEALGRPAARREPGEEDRELQNEMEKERELSRGWWLSRMGL